MMRIDGVSEDEALLIERLLKQRGDKLVRNGLRSMYYDARHQPRDLGVMVPPGFMQRIGAVLGWPAKAVDALAQRTYWQGFIASDSSLQTIVDGLVEDNHLESEFQQAFIASLEHSVSFLIAERGEDGEPEAVITAKDARNGTGEWDNRRRVLASFLSVKELDKRGRPKALALYLPGETLHLEKVSASESDKSGWELDERIATGYDLVPVEPVIFKPRLSRPFGTSRISRPVMTITDMAVRTVIRAELGAEFYSTPQRWLMGADASAFGLDGSGADTWKILIGRIMALGDDDEQKNGRAEVGQFPQISMQPHMDQLRSLAQLFAGETSIPVSSLGISIDSNPTSADSFAASREDIIAEAEGAIREWRGSTARAMKHALELSGIAHGAAIMSQFRDPRYTSRSAAADAFVKTASVMPWLAESEAAIDLLGFDEVASERLKIDRRRALGRASLAKIVSGVSDGNAG